MVVDPPVPIASLRVSPPAPTPLPVIMTINGNGRIIPTSAFVSKGLLAAIAAKPIPRRYTSSMLWNSYLTIIFHFVLVCYCLALWTIL